MSTSSGCPLAFRRMKMFPLQRISLCFCQELSGRTYGCGSQCTVPQRNICAEKRSTIVVMTCFRESPRPPLPDRPFQSSRSGLRKPVPSLSRVETLGRGRGFPFTPGEPLPYPPSHCEVSCSLSQRRTPSIHSVVMIRFEERSR